MNVRENYNNDGYCHIIQMHIAQTTKEYVWLKREQKELRFMSYEIIIPIIVYIPMLFFGIL